MRPASRRITLASRHRRFLAADTSCRSGSQSGPGGALLERDRPLTGRLRTVIVEPRGRGARRTQRLVAWPR